MTFLDGLIIGFVAGSLCGALVMAFIAGASRASEDTQ